MTKVRVIHQDANEENVWSLWFDFLPRKGEIIQELRDAYRIERITHDAATGAATLLVTRVA